MSQLWTHGKNTKIVSIFFKFSEINLTMLDYLPIKGLSIWSKRATNVNYFKIGFVPVDLTEVSYLHNRYKFYYFCNISTNYHNSANIMCSGDGRQCAVSFDMSHANLFEFQLTHLSAHVTHVTFCGIYYQVQFENNGIS